MPLNEVALLSASNGRQDFCVNLVLRRGLRQC